MSQDAVSLGSLIHEDMVYFDVEAETWQDVVRILAGHAIEHGYAVEGYAEDVIEREELYPTGLPTDVMKVAIPHAMVQDHVKEAAIVVGKLAHPVDFKEMGDGENDVPVEMVYMLVAKGDKHYLAVLQQLISVFATPEFMTELKTVEDPASLKATLIDLAGKVVL